LEKDCAEVNQSGSTTAKVMRLMMSLKLKDICLCDEGLGTFKTFGSKQHSSLCIDWEISLILTKASMNSPFFHCAERAIANKVFVSKEECNLRYFFLLIVKFFFFHPF
jgi:hypothetical protein